MVERMKRGRLAHWIVNDLASLDVLNNETRLKLYQHYGLAINSGVFISSRCHFVYPDLANVTLGEKSFLNQFCYLENGHSIAIGRNSCLAPYVKLLTTTHDIGGANRRVGNGCVRHPIVIGDGVWIGAEATVLPGVSIGDGVVVGAGALVIQSCQPHGLYVGVPAKRVKNLA